MVDRILEYISIFLALMIVLPLHEFAHGFAAVKCGDMTPKFNNRYTLNPFAHFDVLGLFCFLFIGFGWARPMPVNPNNFRKYKLGCFSVSVAGVLANYILAFIALPLFYLCALYVPAFGYFTQVLTNTLFYIYRLSLVFFVFNLIPVYPLDGFRILDVFNRTRGKIYMFLRNYGMFVLYALFLLGIIADAVNFPQLDVLSWAINFVVSIISKPITLFWGVIL